VGQESIGFGLRASPSAMMSPSRIHQTLEAALPVGLLHILHKCAVHALDPQIDTQVATVPHMPRTWAAVIVVGSLMDSEEHATQPFTVKPDKEAVLVGTLIYLPLPSQDKLLLLRDSMVQHLFYIARTAPLNRAIRAPQTATNWAHASLIMATEQITGLLRFPSASAQLLLCYGGLGIRHAAIFCNVYACMPASTPAETTMADGPAHLQPLNSSTSGTLCNLWPLIHQNLKSTWPEA
jgi:hypothetical protein